MGWNFIIVSVSSRSYILSYCYKNSMMNIIENAVSVSSRSYILSYFTYKIIIASFSIYVFPSPLGVIFSLIIFVEIKHISNCCVSVSSRSYILSYAVKSSVTTPYISFPSPLGVIFSLIKFTFS